MRLLAPLVLAACGGSTSLPAVDAPGADVDSSPTGDAIATVDPASDGPATVTETVVTIPGSATGRTLDATVFVPSSSGTQPLVIVSPGFQMQRTQYASYARHLATWSFVVVLADYADSGFFVDHQAAANDLSSVIDWAIANQPVDATRIATAGHSLGGKLSVFAATQDSRIRAVVGWDPVDGNNPSVVPEKLGATMAAIAVVGETTNASGGGMPCAPAAENFQQFYAAAPSPALAITVTGADHMDWVDDPSCTFCSLCAPGTADAELARTVTRRLDVAWLRRHLFADAAMDSWLLAPPELPQLTIEHR